jgi:hypothetical protein
MLMWLVHNITAVLCRRLRYIPETVFLNHQGLGLGTVLTSAPCKNAALSQNPGNRKQAVVPEKKNRRRDF